MRTILAIEDTQDNFDLIADIFGDMHRLVHARNGLDGLAQARASAPDLILLDMGLPEMDGWEVAQRLKSDPALANVPIIAITAHAMKGDRERCLAVGCDDYMARPVNVRELTAMVERHLTDDYAGVVD